MLSDEELARLHSADEAYVADLYRRFTPKFRTFLRTILQRPDDVEDVVHDTWLRVLERRTTFKNQGSLDGWLWTICRNTSTDWLRSRRRFSVFHDFRLHPVAPASRYALPENTPEDSSGLALTRLTRRAIIALPDRQFEAVVYRWLMGHSTALTAQLMHVASGTVKATLHRARERLRSEIPDRLVCEWWDSHD